MILIPVREVLLVFRLCNRDFVITAGEVKAVRFIANSGGGISGVIIGGLGICYGVVFSVSSKFWDRVGRKQVPGESKLGAEIGSRDIGIVDINGVCIAGGGGAHWELCRSKNGIWKQRSTAVAPWQVGVVWVVSHGVVVEGFSFRPSCETTYAIRKKSANHVFPCIKTNDKVWCDGVTQKKRFIFEG